MSVNVPNFKLYTGQSIPAIALGTAESSQEDAANAVYTAIKVGYRHIDTASLYKNEEGIGAGIKRALKDFGLKREDLFVTTKLWLTDYDNVPQALETSLEKLFPGDKDAYVDLYLMHSPFGMFPGTQKWDPSVRFPEVYAEMEKLPHSKVRAIGVSNFTISNLKRLLSTAKVTPAVNQVELHINLPQPRLIEFLLSGKYGFPQHDGKVILPEAYAPLGRGNLENHMIKEIAEKHNVQPANVVLSWGVARNTIVLPKSITPSRIESNFHLIELSSEEKATIDKISEKTGLQRYYPMEGPGFDAFNNNEDSK